MNNKSELIRKLIIARDENFQNLICKLINNHKGKILDNKEKLLEDIEIVISLMNELKGELNNV